MVVYNRILEASEAARGTEFSVEKEDLVRRFLSNPLLPVFNLFADFFVGASAEALDLSRLKARSQSASPQKKAKVSNSQENADITPLDKDLLPMPTPSEIVLEGSSPSTPPPNKRIFSGESYGQQSTETTPQKMKHAEPLTQALQNTLIGTLLTQVWFGAVKIPWAQNRKMHLDYRPYLPDPLVIECRTFSTSFRCRLDGNKGNAFDRIIAIPDGALVLVTNKKSNPNSRLIWSLQAVALAIEVSIASTLFLTVG
jgi:hypothetical protein